MRHLVVLAASWWDVLKYTQTCIPSQYPIQAVILGLQRVWPLCLLIGSPALASLEQTSLPATESIHIEQESGVVLLALSCDSVAASGSLLPFVRKCTAMSREHDFHHERLRFGGPDSQCLL